MESVNQAYQMELKVEKHLVINMKKKGATKRKFPSPFRGKGGSSTSMSEDSK